MSLHPVSCRCGRCVHSNPDILISRLAHFKSINKTPPSWYPTDPEIIRKKMSEPQPEINADGSTNPPTTPADESTEGEIKKIFFPKPKAVPVAKSNATDMLEGSGFWSYLAETLNEWFLSGPDVKRKIRSGDAVDKKFDDLLVKAYPGAELDTKTVFWGAIFFHYVVPILFYQIPKMIKDKGKAFVGWFKDLFGKKKKEEPKPKLESDAK